MTDENLDLTFGPVALDHIQGIRAMDDFPVARGPALALIRLTQRESTSLVVLAHALKADPVFCVRLIRVANGAGGNGGRAVVSLRDAVSVLGIPAVRALALGFSLLSTHRRGKCCGFDYRRFWSHSLARAVGLQLLNGAIHRGESEEAFSVGLLARAGELALADVFPEQYAQLLDRHRQEPASRLADREQQAFGVTHELLTASILADSGLPEDCIEAAKLFESCEEQPPAKGSDRFVMLHLLAVADRIADICVAPEAEWHRLMPRLFHLGARLGLNAPDLIATCNRTAHEWREWGAALELDIGPMPRFENVSAHVAQAARPPLSVAAPLKPTPPVIVSETTAQRREVAPDAASNRSLRILVVSAQEPVRQQICEALAATGHSVSLATHGPQALAMALERSPQIMLVDLQGADMDGIELTDNLRQFKAGRGIYILMLSEPDLSDTADDDEKLARAFAAGVDDFLLMPVRPRVLAARLHAAQRVVGLREELAREQEETRRISAELSATNQQLQAAGMTDMLTGCPNHRAAMERIHQEWAMATRSMRPLACMAIEIDDFKRVNDIRGRAAGDTVLKLVASALKDEMRAQDVLARSGGDEFMVICPDTTLEAAMACAERMRAAVKALPIIATDENLHGSVSIGVAVRDAVTADPDALVRLADQSAYLAKRRRNCVAAVQSGSRLSAASA